MAAEVGTPEIAAAEAALQSFAALLDEENALLDQPSRNGGREGGRDGGMGTLVDAKLRLAGAVEAACVRLGGQWAATVAPDDRTRLAALVAGIRERLSVNERLLRRRIELCDEVMGAVAAEARRLSGARSVTYGAQGAMARAEQAAPIAVNASL